MIISPATSHAQSGIGQPLTDSDAVSSPPQAEVLRWKQPAMIVNPYVGGNVGRAGGTNSAPQRDEEIRPAAPIAASQPRAVSPRTAAGAGWNKSRIDGHQGAARPVRLAAHDPLSDPFGDGGSDNEVTNLQPPAGRSAAPESGDLPPPAEPAPGARPEPMPGEGALPTPMDEVPPGARIYNQRDCEKQETACQQLREELRAKGITKISLDITPLYVQPPNRADDPIEFRRFELRVAESRQWRDPSGRVLATGRLGNLEYDRVIVVDDAGNEVARLRLAELGRDEHCFVTAWWQLPYECSADPEFEPRNWVASTFAYQASALCHKPLYFEEVQLERYGHTAGPFKQPIISGAHFFANIAVLPYKMAISPPMECEYPLGYYRPGSCAPWHIPPIPLSLRGALAEAGAWIGGVYVIP